MIWRHACAPLAQLLFRFVGLGDVVGAGKVERGRAHPRVAMTDFPRYRRRAIQRPCFGKIGLGDLALGAGGSEQGQMAKVRRGDRYIATIAKSCGLRRENHVGVQ